MRHHLGVTFMSDEITDLWDFTESAFTGESLGQGSALKNVFYVWSL